MGARKLGKRLLLVGLGLALALGAAELGLRTFAPQGVVTDWVRYEAAPDPVGYRMRPNQWIPGRLGGPINAHGLRGGAWTGDGPRTLVLGDSFVFGAGVPLADTFVARLDAGGDDEVVNGGTPGYGTWRQMAWLERYGAELELDAVLLCVFEGNDFQDNLETRAPELAGGVLFGPAGADEEVRAWRGWLSRSHVYRALTRRVMGAGASDASTPSVAAGGDGPGFDAVLDQFARAQAPRLAVYTPDGLEDSALTRRIELCYAMTSLALDGVATWCAENGAELRVVLIPDVLAVDPQQRARALAQNADAELAVAINAGLDLGRPGRALAAWCAELGVPLLDLTPQFRARTAELLASEPDSEGLYLFGDSHWNARGHALAAKAIADWRK